jgi:hypothetical protein
VECYLPGLVHGEVEGGAGDSYVDAVMPPDVIYSGTFCLR